MRALVATLALLAAVPAGATTLEGPDDADRNVIRWVVKREIKALQRDHRDAAYTFVSPSARQIFPDKDQYMEKMLENFPGLSYATSVVIGDLRQTSRGLAQMVTLVDRRGQPYVAFFFMEKTEEAGWMIHNFIMVPLRAANV